MNKKILLILLISLIFITSISSVSAAENTTDDIVSIENQEQSTTLSDGTSDDINIIANSATYTYGTANVKYEFKIYNSTTNKPIKGASYSFNINSKIPSKEGFSDDNGLCVVKFKPSDVTLDEAIINVNYNNCWNWKTVKITIKGTGASSNTNTPSVSSTNTNVNAPSVTVPYQGSNYFKVTVKDSKNKPIKNLKLKFKVYTGNSYKTYTVKTNTNGIASLSTKNLKAGTHKVTVTSGNSKYDVSASSKITVQPVKFTIGKYTGKFTLSQINSIKKAKNNGYYKTITVKTGKYIKGKYPVKMSLSAYGADGNDPGYNKAYLEYKYSCK